MCGGGGSESGSRADVKMKSQASAPRDVFPPTPPGPEGSNGNGLLRVQWVAGAWLRLDALRRIGRSAPSGKRLSQPYFGPISHQDALDVGLPQCQKVVVASREIA